MTTVRSHADLPSAHVAPDVPPPARGTTSCAPHPALIHNLPSPIPETRRRILLWAWCASLAGYAMGSVTPIPLPVGLYRFVFGIVTLDEILHFLLFVIFAFVPVLLVRQRWRMVLLAIGTTGYGLFAEYLQLLNPERRFSHLDMAANVLGCLAGIMLALSVRALWLHRFPLGCESDSSGNSPTPATNETDKDAA